MRGTCGSGGWRTMRRPSRSASASAARCGCNSPNRQPRRNTWTISRSSRWGACTVSSSRKRRARMRAPTLVASSVSISADASITITAVPYCPQDFHRGSLHVYGFEAREPLPHLAHRWFIGELADLAKDVVGERQAVQRGARLELAVQVVGDVAQLDHLGHVFRLFACAAHVKIVGGCALGSARRHGWPFQLSQRAQCRRSPKLEPVDNIWVLPYRI